MAKKIVKTQKLKEIESHIQFSGEQSPYWDWVRDNHTDSENKHEHYQANPDGLAEDRAFFANSELTEAQEIMGRAISQLEGRPKEAYLLTMREGKSFAEAAAILKVSKAAIQIYRQRAIKFIAAYCKLAMRNRGL
jgi:DNA-directed RNA polymerase specialized sigma24 family protein